MTERTYPPAVWWMPKRVRDALRYEEGMRGIAAQPVTSDEGGEPPIGVCDEPEEQVEPGRIFTVGVEDSYEGRRLVAADRSVVEEYHRLATSGDGGGYWCRNDNCMHRAPGPGEPCPVCKDRGWKAIELGGDAA